MSFSSTLAKLLKRDSEARQAAADQYRQLIVDAASDRPVSQAQIEQTLAAAGKSLADLARDVERERERVRNIGVVGRRDELLAESRALTEAAAAEQERFLADYRTLIENHRAAGAQFQQRHAALGAQIAECAKAERSLTSSDSRLTAIRAELGSLVQDERVVLARYGGLRSRVPADTLNGDIAAAQLERIDGRRRELQDEQVALEQALLSVPN